eukprot:2727427-Amphidinium_carterae.2
MKWTFPRSERGSAAGRALLGKNGCSNNELQHREGGNVVKPGAAARSEMFGRGLASLCARAALRGFASWTMIVIRHLLTWWKSLATSPCRDALLFELQSEG